MSENGENGTGAPKMPPQESNLRRDEVMEVEEGYNVVSSALRGGRNVLMGDIHYEKNQQQLFKLYLEKLIRGGILFTLGVELSSVVKFDVGRTTEDALRQVDGLYANGGGEFDPGYREQFATIIDEARLHNIPIKTLDNDSFWYKNLTPPSMTRDEYVASQIQSVAMKPVLALLGAQHVKSDAVPSHIDALAVKIGEDKSDSHWKKYDPGSFDIQIKLDSPTAGKLS